MGGLFLACLLASILTLWGDWFCLLCASFFALCVCVCVCGCCDCPCRQCSCFYPVISVNEFDSLERIAPHHCSVGVCRHGKECVWQVGYMQSSIAAVVTSTSAPFPPPHTPHQAPCSCAREPCGVLARLQTAAASGWFWGWRWGMGWLGLPTQKKRWGLWAIGPHWPLAVC